MIGTQVHKKQGKPVTYGFTAMELLVVVAIIGLLASIIFAALNTARKDATTAKTQGTMEQLRTALQTYKNKYKEFPPSGNGNDWVCIGEGYSGGMCWEGAFAEHSTFFDEIEEFMNIRNVDPIASPHGALYRRVDSNSYELVWTLSRDDRDCDPGRPLQDSDFNITVPTGDSASGFTFCFYSFGG